MPMSMPMTEPPLTAALLGLQHPHSDTHLQMLLRIPEVAQVILCDSDAYAVNPRCDLLHLARPPIGFGIGRGSLPRKARR
jgi:hypothetical protein